MLETFRFQLYIFKTLKSYSISIVSTKHEKKLLISLFSFLNSKSRFIEINFDVYKIFQEFILFSNFFLNILRIMNRGNIIYFVHFFIDRF